MRAGFLIDRWQPVRGGAEAMLAQLARHLESKGHGVHAFGERGPGPGEDAPGTFHAVATRGLTRSSRERALGLALVAAADDAGCDVTIGVRHLERVDLLWCHGGAHLATLRARRRAARGGRAPDGDPPVRGRHRTFLDLERAALEGGARVVVCPSELVCAELAELYPLSRERLVVVPNGIDLERFHPRERAGASAALRAELGLADGIPLVVLAARNPIVKGLPQLLIALEGLLDVPWHLLVAGPRRTRRWIRRAARLGPSRVTVQEHVDPVQLAAGADLCVLPTWRDTSGLVVLEALACGTRVVTTRHAGAADVVTAPGIGTVLDDPEPGALAAAIRARLGVEPDVEAARAAVASRAAEDMLATLERICADLAVRS